MPRQGDKCIICGKPIWGQYTYGVENDRKFCEHATESPYGDPNRMIESEDSRFEKAKPVRATRITNETISESDM